MYKTLHDGDYFGEIALIEKTKRNAGVRSVTVCSVCVLQKSDFDVVLEAFPEFAKILQAKAAERKAETARLKNTGHIKAAGKFLRAKNKPQQTTKTSNSQPITEPVSESISSTPYMVVDRFEAHKAVERVALSTQKSAIQTIKVSFSKVQSFIPGIRGIELPFRRTSTVVAAVAHKAIEVCPVRPYAISAAWVQRWQMLIGCLAMVVVFYEPIAIALRLESKPLTHMLDIIISLLLFADVWMVANTTFYRDGVPVTQACDIIIHYARGLLVIDVVAALPCMAVHHWAGGSYSFSMSFLRCLPMLKAVVLPRFSVQLATVVRNFFVVRMLQVPWNLPSSL